MTNLKDFLEAVDYRISSGSEYCWTCFGPNARYLDCGDSESNDAQFSVSAIFDSVDQTIYSIEAWDYTNDREYRWLNPEFANAFTKESIDRNVDSKESCDGRKFIDLELIEDMYDKIQGIVAGADYDPRVQVPLTLDKEQIYELMHMAHERDITLNQLVEEVLKNEIERLENGI
jgi:hypothetical protein